MNFEHQSAILSLRGAGICYALGFSSTPLLRRQQPSPHHVQVGQSKHGVKARRVLCQAAVTHLGKAPQLLDDTKGVLAAGARGGPSAVHSSPVLTQRLLRPRAAVDLIAHAMLLGSEAVHLAP